MPDAEFTDLFGVEFTVGPRMDTNTGRREVWVDLHPMTPQEAVLLAGAIVNAARVAATGTFVLPGGDGGV